MIIIIIIFFIKNIKNNIEFKFYSFNYMPFIFILCLYFFFKIDEQIFKYYLLIHYYIFVKNNKKLKINELIIIFNYYFKDIHIHII